MPGRFSMGMQRYTRLSDYIDRKKMNRTKRANRPGNQGFTFTGDFPEAHDWQPVEAQRFRRSYTDPSGDGGVSDVVAAQVEERLPLVSRYGVRTGLAVTVLAVFAALLCALWVGAYSVNAGLSRQLAQQEVRVETLTQSGVQLRSEIAVASSEVNVRQEAVRIGLRSSHGMAWEYVSVPTNAVIDPASYGLRQNTASIFGQ